MSHAEAVAHVEADQTTECGAGSPDLGRLVASQDPAEPLIVDRWITQLSSAQLNSTQLKGELEITEAGTRPVGLARLPNARGVISVTLNATGSNRCMTATK